MAIYQRTWHMDDGSTKVDEVDLPLANEQTYEKITNSIQGVSKIVLVKIADNNNSSNIINQIPNQ